MKLTRKGSAISEVPNDSQPHDHIQAGEMRFALSEENNMLDIAHQLKTSGTFPVTPWGSASFSPAFVQVIFYASGTLELKYIPSQGGSNTTYTHSWFSGTPASFPYTINGVPFAGGVSLTSGSNVSGTISQYPSAYRSDTITVTSATGGTASYTIQGTYNTF